MATDDHYSTIGHDNHIGHNDTPLPLELVTDGFDTGRSSYQQATLTSLPDELILNIATSILLSNDLYQLSKVSDRFQRICTEVESRHMHLCCSHGYSWHHNTKWSDVFWNNWQNLLLQPHRAPKVRSLIISVEDLQSTFNNKALGEAIPTHLRQLWNRKGSLKSPVEVAGLVIMMLSRLQRSHIDLFSMQYPEDDNYYPLHGNPLTRLFDCDPASDDILSIPGLQYLRILTLVNVQVSWPWFTLPRLRRVEIDASCTIERDNKPSETSNVTCLTLRLAGGAINAHRSYLEALPNFVRHFVHLRELTFFLGFDKMGPED